MLCIFQWLEPVHHKHDVNTPKLKIAVNCLKFRPKIIHIEKDVSPCKTPLEIATCQSIIPEGQAVYVLEVTSGFVEQNNITKDSISDLATPTYENLMKVCIMHSDAIMAGSKVLSPTLTKFIESSNKPFLPFAPKDTIKEDYTSFIKNYLL